MKKKVTKNPEAKQPAIVTEITQFLGAAAKLDKALATAIDDVTRAESHVDEMRGQFAQSCAAGILDPEADNSKASADYENSKTQLEKARLLCDGIRKLISVGDGRIVDLSERFEKYRSSVNAKQLRSYIDEHLRPAEKAYFEVLNRAKALCMAFSVSEDALAPITNCEVSASKDAMQFYEANANLLKLSEGLRKYKGDQELRERIAERHKRVKSLFSVEASYRCIRPFVANGKEYAVNDVVNAYKLDSILLGKLYTANYLRMIEKTDSWSQQAQ